MKLTRSITTAPGWDAIAGTPRPPGPPAKEHNAMTWQGLEPGPLYLDWKQVC